MHVSDEMVRLFRDTYSHQTKDSPLLQWEPVRAALLSALAPVEPVAMDDAWDIATEALDDSMDMDWTTRRGARSVVNALKDAGFLAITAPPTPSA